MQRTTTYAERRSCRAEGNEQEIYLPAKGKYARWTLGASYRPVKVPEPRGPAVEDLQDRFPIDASKTRSIARDDLWAIPDSSIGRRLMETERGIVTLWTNLGYLRDK